MENTEEKEQIAESAKQVLEKLLEMLELPGAVGFTSGYFHQDEDEEDTIALNIEGEDLGILIGRRGQTLLSLQYLVRIMVSQRISSELPIIIDIEGYRRRRCDNLRNLAWRVAEQVMSRRAPFTLEPMTPFDRRVIHLALLDHPEVTTQSTGMGDLRKVVVLPRPNSA
ncbi:MAG: R3H domain-containing nucleic acid-binding protein [Chloroflexota bacterium]